ncbi:MAG: DUF5050 domain-containing protein [Eubacterium sp.]|nr:DUF5050 domain-containing protein [Eubacterium sp.]
MKKILVVVVILVALIAAALIFGKKDDVNYKNVETQTGNTGGNLYNEGLFCEYNGTIYFANPMDEFKLYSMPALGGKAVKLGDDSARYINVDDNCIYYAKGSSVYTEPSSGGDYVFENMHFNDYIICRVNHNGKQKKYLQKDPALYLCLMGNKIFYMHYDNSEGSSLYSVSINGENDEQVTSEMIRTCSAEDGVLYYNGIDTDHKIYAMDMTTGSKTVLKDGNYWMPIYADGYLFYLDLDRDYALCRYNLSTEEEIVLVSGDVELYNVYGSTVYYQTFGEDAALYSINFDGTDNSKIKDGTYCNINVTSSYVFFRAYTDSTFYYFPSNSPGSVSVFIPEVEE